MKQFIWEILLGVAFLIAGIVGSFAQESGGVLQYGSLATVSSEENEAGADDIADEVGEYVYKPMLVDGKEWVVLHWSNYFPASNNGYGIILTIRVVGDDYMDGKKCKKLVLNFEVPYHRCICMSCRHLRDGLEFYAYESNRQLYVYHNPREYDRVTDDGLTEPAIMPGWWDIYLDFSATVGDKVKGYIIEDEYFTQVGDGWNRTLEVYGHPIIEEIGSLNLTNFWDSRFAEDESLLTAGWGVFAMWKCSLNGETLLDRTSELSADGTLDIVTAVEELPEEIADPHPTYFNLQGIPVCNPVKGQLYICKGKKVLF